MGKRLDRTFLVDMVERAMKRHGVKSRRALARRLDVSHQTVQYWLDGSTAPENGVTVKLAEMAEIDPGEALLRVNRARAKNKKERKVWDGLIEALQKR